MFSRDKSITFRSFCRINAIGKVLFGTVFLLGLGAALNFAVSADSADTRSGPVRSATPPKGGTKGKATPTAAPRNTPNNPNNSKGD